MFENVFDTVMDMKGKTKDNMNARIYISLFCYHVNDGSRVAKPKVSFVLNNNA